MMSGWDEAAQAVSESGGDGMFLRLKNNGDKVVGAFCGEPYVRKLLWVEENGQRKVIAYNPDNPDHASERPSIRLLFNFYVPERQRMCVYECGPRVFKTIQKVRDKYGLGKWLFEITRNGESGSPQTTYDILPDTQIDGALADEIASAELNDLKSLA